MGCMKQHESWKRLGRKTIHNTPHLRVHVDTVQLPDGAVMDDYSVVEFNDPVLNIVTDQGGNVLMLEEYRYAIDQTMWNVPAGSIRAGSEDMALAAKRELLEETGYTSDDITRVGELHDYPTKATHTVHVFRVKNARKVADVQHEASESIRLTLMRPEEVKKLIFENEVKTTAVFAAIVLAMPELFGKDN
jgi:ADP-ribose pyrophosphatase